MRVHRFLTVAAVAGLAVAAGSPRGASAASSAASLKVIYSFCQKTSCADGDQPYGGLMQDASGRLLGTTGFGGKYNGGTVFALTPRGGVWKHHNLKSFCVGTPPSCQSDEGPFTTLIEDTSGNIYGTVYFGGANAQGAVFELKLTQTGKYRLKYLYSFNGTDGFGPFELTYAGASTGAPYDGKSPLYSTTVAGGTNNAGIVFSLTPSKGGTWTLQTLYNFCSAQGCTDGGIPYAGVTIDPSGNLFGTTDYYGANNAGVIYELTSTNGSWSEKLLYTFCSASGCSDGNGPFAGVARDSAGNLYGTTYFGGAQSKGVVFELTSNGTYSVLHNFCSESNCSDGSQPAAAVTLDASGNIFGTTGRGGDNNFGTVFKIASGSFKRVYSFCALTSCADGGYPYGTLIFDSTGDIFGTTQYGGGKGLGEVYKLKP